VTFQVRPALPADAGGIRDLFARTFGRVMTADEWSWKYPGNPDGWYAYVAEIEGRIVGHYGGWPLRAIVGNSEETIVSVGDVATEPSVRHLGGRRNVFRSMAEEMFARLRADGVPFVFGFPNARALLAGERLLGYRAEFPVREVVYEIGSAPAAGAATASEWLDEPYDALWRSVAGGMGAGLVRDRRRMNWRYHARPDRYYRFVTLTGSRPGPRACGVLAVTGGDALVVDVVAQGEEDVLALVGALEAEAASMGARRLVFWETAVSPLAAVAGPARTRPGGFARDAGFSFATVPFDAARTDGFVRRAPISAGIYDDR